MGFANEKDHPEVAPSQFEMNYSYTEAVVAADQVQLYKLIARQVAAQMDMTACFLPKPVTGVNGNGMHTNMSIAQEGQEPVLRQEGPGRAVELGWNFIDRILANGNDICLILNSSVNSYRRLDPHFEAPNQIKASAIDRGSMVRIPLGNERSARIEVRSIAPDANPYLAIYSLFRTGLEGPGGEDDNDGKRSRTRFLPDNIYDAIRLFKGSKFAQELLGDEVHEKFAELKLASAERCPKALGAIVKRERDPVPPRGHEPVPVGAVLSPGGRGGAGCPPLSSPAVVRFPLFVSVFRCPFSVVRCPFRRSVRPSSVTPQEGLGPRPQLVPRLVAQHQPVLLRGALAVAAPRVEARQQVARAGRVFPVVAPGAGERGLELRHGLGLTARVDERLPQLEREEHRHRCERRGLPALGESALASIGFVRKAARARRRCSKASTSSGRPRLHRGRRREDQDLRLGRPLAQAPWSETPGAPRSTARRASGRSCRASPAAG